MIPQRITKEDNSETKTEVCSGKHYDEKQSKIKGQNGRRKEGATSQRVAGKISLNGWHLSRDLNEMEAQEPCDKKKKKKEPCGYGVEVGKSCEQKNYTHCVLEKNHLGWSGI